MAPCADAMLLAGVPTVDAVLNDHVPIVAAVRRTWPDAGFHRRLVQLTLNRFWKHPLTPLPMVKW